MFKNLKQMNSLISEMRKLTNDPNALKDPQAIMDSMGINQEELEQQLSGILTKKATLKHQKQPYIINYMSHKKINLN